MLTKAQTFKLGVFVLGCTAIAVALLVVFVRQRLFESTATYFLRVPGNVSGVERGSTVSVRGVRVGEVEEIELYADDQESVRLTLAIDRDVPINRDAEASFSFQGLTGQKVVDISGGSAGAGTLDPGSYIEYRESLFQLVTDQAEGILARADALLATTTVLVEQITEVTRRIDADRIDAVLVDAQDAVERFEAAGAELESLIQGTKQPLQQTLRSADSAFRGATAVTQDAQAVLENVNGFTIEARSVVRANDAQLRAITYNLREATQSFKHLGRELRQRPSRLLLGGSPPERDLP